MSGCASSSARVTLLADEPGSGPGAVAVMDARSQAEVGALTAANTTTSLGGKVQPRPADPAAYADLLSAARCRRRPSISGSISSKARPR